MGQYTLIFTVDAKRGGFVVLIRKPGGERGETNGLFGEIVWPLYQRG
jgi:hypothetical protein